MKFHTWVPNLFGCQGGIQVYSGFLLQAIQKIYPQSRYDIFVKHDLKTSSDFPYLPDTRFHFAGDYSLKIRTPAFASQIITQGFLQRPDIIISSHLNFTVAAYWLKCMTGIPYWTVAHGIDAWNIQNRALKNALHHADLILAVSSYTRERLIKEQKLNPDKVSILPNTFDANRFNIAPKPEKLLQKYNLKPDQPTILTVARLSNSEQYKGYDKILSALPKIRQQIPNVRYILVGKGNDKPRIEKLISQYQIQECVTLTGYIPDEELSEHYNLCDVFAMPSKAEGFGIVYLEALASGKPVLAGNQDGAVDPLCQGELGALIDPDDSEAIAQTLIQILRSQYPNPLLYQPLKLRQQVIERFGSESFGKTLGNYLKYHTALNKKALHEDGIDAEIAATHHNRSKLDVSRTRLK